MQTKDTMQIKGKVRLIGRNKDGSIAFDYERPNLITNAGYDFICDVIGLNAQPSDITHMAIGSGTAGDATATALASEDDREEAEYAHTPGTKTCTFTSTFSDVAAATEYGLLNASEAGTLLNTAGFDAITIDSLTIVATITLS